MQSICHHFIGMQINWTCYSIIIKALPFIFLPLQQLKFHKHLNHSILVLLQAHLSPLTQLQVENEHQTDIILMPFKLLPKLANYIIILLFNVPFRLTAPFTTSNIFFRCLWYWNISQFHHTIIMHTLHHQVLQLINDAPHSFKIAFGTTQDRCNSMFFVISGWRRQLWLDQGIKHDKIIMSTTKL